MNIYQTGIGGFLCGGTWDGGRGMGEGNDRVVTVRETKDGFTAIATASEQVARTQVRPTPEKALSELNHMLEQKLD